MSEDKAIYAAAAATTTTRRKSDTRPSPRGVRNLDPELLRDLHVVAIQERASVGALLNEAMRMLLAERQRAEAAGPPRRP